MYRNFSKLLRITNLRAKAKTLGGTFPDSQSFGDCVSLSFLVKALHSLDTECAFYFPCLNSGWYHSFSPLSFSNFLCSQTYRFVSFLKGWREGSHRLFFLTQVGKDAALCHSLSTGFGNVPLVADISKLSLSLYFLSSSLQHDATVSPTLASHVLCKGQKSGVAWESRTQHRFFFPCLCC